MKTAPVSGVLLAALVPLVAWQSPELGAAPDPCTNLMAHEPMLVFDITGSTIAGPVDRTLTVYNDGWTKLSEASTTGPGKCSSVKLPQDVAAALHTGLVQAGGFTLCDDARTVADLPLRTLTILGNAQTTRSHTFSYWVGDQVYTGVDALLEQFIAEQFQEN